MTFCKLRLLSILMIFENILTFSFFFKNLIFSWGRSIIKRTFLSFLVNLNFLNLYLLIKFGFTSSEFKYSKLIFVLKVSSICLFKTKHLLKCPMPNLLLAKVKITTFFLYVILYFFCRTCDLINFSWVYFPK